jgi:hypothetical protein
VDEDEKNNGEIQKVAYPNLFHDISPWLSPSCLVNVHYTSYVLLLCISSVKIHISNM